jgi:hypothetical protein
MAHRKARLTPFGRLLIVQRVDQLDWTVAKAAKATGVSWVTIHKWVRRTDANARQAFRSGPPAPELSGVLPPRTVMAVLRAPLSNAAPSPGLGPFHAPVHRLRDPLPPRDEPPGSHRRPTGATIGHCKDHPGELAHIDVKKLGMIPEDGVWRKLGRTTASRRMECGASWDEPRPPGGWSVAQAGTNHGHPEGGVWRKLGRTTATKRWGGGYDYQRPAVDDHSRLPYEEVHPR